MLLAMPTARATMEARLEDQEARLTPQVQVADHIDGVLVLVGGRLFVAALLTTARVGQGELDLEAVPVARAPYPNSSTPGGKSNFTLTST